MTRCQDWVLGWFQGRCPARDLAWERDAETDFFGAGWIDSFASVELIEDAEAEFQIRFTEGDLADARFSTMSGLAELITRRGSSSPS